MVFDQVKTGVKQPVIPVCAYLPRGPCGFYQQMSPLILTRFEPLTFIENW